MATLHDLTCPRCGSADAVVKEDLDAYRCTDCEATFSAADVTPE
ncbi:MAG: hypothetical protein ACOC0X_01270 [Halobacteriota archaeon]